MIDLYFSPTPNGLKIKLFLEETDLPHRIIPMRLSAGEQFTPEFVAISPNAKMPAIVDHAPSDGGTAQAVFESGAILWYLAEKTGRLLPANQRERLDALQWLFWQMAGLGPMAGQAGYFRVYASEPHAAHGQNLAAFANLARWFRTVAVRPATQRTYAGVEDVYARRGAPVATSR